MTRRRISYRLLRVFKGEPYARLLFPSPFVSASGSPGSTRCRLHTLCKYTELINEPLRSLLLVNYRPKEDTDRLAAAVEQLAHTYFSSGLAARIGLMRKVLRCTTTNLKVLIAGRSLNHHDL